MATYKERLAQGLCGKCGTNPKPEKGSLCPDCKEKERLRVKQRRANAKAEKRCLGCNVKLGAKAGTRCEACKEKAKQSRQRSIDRNKAEGTCVSSGCHNKAKDGCTLCQYCITYRSEVSSKHYRMRKDAGTCLYCKQAPEPDKVLCSRHLEKYADYRLQAKLAAFEAYGGPVCQLCNNDNVDVLEIDHIEGGGRQHLRDIGLKASGYQFYLWLRRNGYPDGFRVLCPTCNKQAHFDKTNSKYK